MSRSFLPASLALLAAISVATAGAAAPLTVTGYDENSETLTRVVHLSDVELHTQAGAKVAAFRIEQAAADVCGRDDPLARQAIDYVSCRKDATDRALGDLGAPLVAVALGRPTDQAFAGR